MELMIRFADASLFDDPARFDAAYAAVSAARREKLDRLRAPEARRLSLAAGLLLQRTLAEAGIEGTDAETAAGAYGKPYLPRRPDVHFSLSHSGQRVMCVVAGRPVGCDIQIAAPRNLRIAQRFFTAEECGRIFSQETEAARQEMFFRIWTLKESYVKCVGLGLALPLNAFSVLPEEDGVSLTQREVRGCFRLMEVPCDAAYRSACCIRTD